MSESAISKNNENTEPSVPVKLCENCQTPVQGMYCSQCGQSVESTLKYFWTVILHLLDDIFSFDSRASRTLFPLIFRPGFLTNKYIAGRRVHYVPPLKLYLFISIVFFLSLKFLTLNDNNLVNIQNSQKITKQIDQQLSSLESSNKESNEQEQASISNSIQKLKRYKTIIENSKSIAAKSITQDIVELEIEKLVDRNNFTDKQQETLDELLDKLDKLERGEKLDFQPEKFVVANNEDGTLTFDFLSAENNKKLIEFAKLLAIKAEKAFTEDPTPLIKEAIEKLPQLMFILLPIFAALLKIMFIFSKRLYLEHLTVALHSHSFIFLSILLLEFFEYMQGVTKNNYTVIAEISAVLGSLILFWIPIYLFIMQKRVYKQGVLLTTLKYGAIGTIYIVMIAITGSIAFIWGLAST